MEAAIGLFLIVTLFALLSGAGRSSGAGEQRPVTRSESVPSTSAGTPTTTQEGGMGSLLPALILLLTVVALMYNAG